MKTWDVIVVGLGGVGSAAAHHLSTSGSRVLGIDQHAPVHSLGSSHGRTRAIRLAYFEHPSYVPLLRRAYELWDELDRSSPQKLFQRTGIIEIGPPDGVVVPGILKSAKEHRLSIETFSSSELSQRWPGLRAEDNWQAILERNAGFLNVEACVAEHLRLALSSGATCLHETKVLDWSRDGSGVRVTTEKGDYCAAKLVLAGGPWSTPLLQDAGVPLQVLRKHQYWYRANAEGYERGDGFPCFFHETPTGYFYGFPSIDGSGVKVARHSGGTVIDQPTAVHPSDQGDRQLIDDYLRSYLPGVGTELVEEQGCYYTVTPDEHFVIDEHPGDDRVMIIAGLSGHGFKFTSVLGELACQLASGQTPALEIGLFRLSRFRETT